MENYTAAEHAWERQEGEPENHYSWFHCYLLQGPTRTLIGTYNQVQQQKAEAQAQKAEQRDAEAQPTDAGQEGPSDAPKARKGPKRPAQSTNLPGLWKTVVRRWQWAERARLWDAHQQYLAELEWEKRSQTIAQQGWSTSQKLIERGSRMLDWPLSKTTTSKDGKTITIEPTSWSLHTAVRILREGDRLGRLACGMNTERTMKQIEAMDVDELRAEAISLLLAEGYEVTKREDADVTFHGLRAVEEELVEIPVEQAMDALRAQGYLVVPPMKEASAEDA